MARRVCLRIKTLIPMETLENRLQKRIHVSLYALLFLTTLLGLSVLLEGCSDKSDVANKYVYVKPVFAKVSQTHAAVSLLAAQDVHKTVKITTPE